MFHLISCYTFHNVVYIIYNKIITITRAATQNLWYCMTSNLTYTCTRYLIFDCEKRGKQFTDYGNDGQFIILCTGKKRSKNRNLANVQRLYSAGYAYITNFIGMSFHKVNPFPVWFRIGNKLLFTEMKLQCILVCPLCLPTFNLSRIMHLIFTTRLLP